MSRLAELLHHRFDAQHLFVTTGAILVALHVATLRMFGNDPEEEVMSAVS